MGKQTVEKEVQRVKDQISLKLKFVTKGIANLKAKQKKNNGTATELDMQKMEDLLELRKQLWQAKIT